MAQSNSSYGDIFCLWQMAVAVSGHKLLFSIFLRLKYTHNTLFSVRDIENSVPVQGYSFSLRHTASGYFWQLTVTVVQLKA